MFESSREDGKGLETGRRGEDGSEGERMEVKEGGETYWGGGRRGWFVGREREKERWGRTLVFRQRGAGVFSSRQWVVSEGF